MAIRLIDTKRLRFKEFVGLDRPDYAILSHTWGDDEITYQDMLRIGEDPNDPGTETAGYAKIKSTCQLAASNGIRFAWVDTCCIDKRSSAELSEAINSMYRWYQEARVCYALLADYGVDSAGLRTDLRGCRWFTRGWCLQELIAPRNLEFYDANWKPIGCREDLASLISGITMIDTDVLLDNTKLHSRPVARRMSWAARRQTTREEDMAYCLLGIFNVNMPLLYGEGSRAFLRLQEEIIKTSNDLSLFAFNQPGLVSINLFAASPKDFASCNSLVNVGTGAHWNDAFSLTNKGLYFRRAKLQIYSHWGLYSMPLSCNRRPPGFRDSRMFLQKVGPGVFAKSHWYPATSSFADNLRDEQRTTETVEAYIITNPVQAQLDRAGENAVYISAKGRHGLSRALQVLHGTPTSENWDTANMRFITTGEPYIQGYWKLFPSLATRTAMEGPRYATRTSPQSHCYLVCGVEHPRESSLARTQAWVRLCSEDKWRALESTFGLITRGDDYNSPLFTGQESDHITLGDTSEIELTVTATVKRAVRGDVPCFELELEFDRMAHS